MQDFWWKIPYVVTTATQQSGKWKNEMLQPKG